MSLENGMGEAGRIVIEGGEMLLDDAMILAETQGAGAASHVDLRLQALRVKGNGRISASAQEGSAGDAGNIVIEATSVV